MTPGTESLETAIHRIGADLHRRMQREYARLARTHRWELLVLRWCLHDAALRTQILRFLDCLPALAGPRDVVQHLRAYFPESQARLPVPLRLGLAAARPGLVTAGMVAAVTRQTATAIARLFLAGADLPDAVALVARLEARGFGVSLDLLGEATVSEADADRYAQRYLELIQAWPRGSASHGDFLRSPHLSLKLSSLAFPCDPVDPEGVYRRVAPRLASICQAAWARDGFINVDMEQYQSRDLTLGLVRRLLDERFPRESRLGVVIQAYLRDAEPVTQQLLQWLESRRAPITVRLVRGAYWDSEVLLARQRRWPCPVYTRKAETDAAFERLTDLLLTRHAVVRPAIATHNVRALARAIAQAEALRVPPANWECQVLYGVGEAVQHAVHALGIPVRVYAPVGDLLPGMAYLVRRILENSTNTSFLVQSLMEDRPVETLLEAPTPDAIL